MAISIGTQLGSITALLGKGGRGEVYRARDLKLKRTITGPDGSTTTYWYGPTSSYLDSSVDGYGVGQVVDFRERSTLVVAKSTSVTVMGLSCLGTGEFDQGHHNSKSVVCDTKMGSSYRGDTMRRPLERSIASRYSLTIINWVIFRVRGSMP